MQQIHYQEKEQFERLFRNEKIDCFEERFRILEVFLNTEYHVTDEELIQILKEQGFAFAPEFVRDTLALMCRYGFAQKNEFDDGVVRYEHRHLCQHHDHLICTRCGKITEFRNEELEAVQVRIASVYGFHMLQHSLKIYGICSECLSEKKPLIPLAYAKQREVLTIREINGGMTSRMRLTSMGLRIGDRVEVITNTGNGQMVVAADCKRYALGRGLAEKIMVRPEK